MLGWKESLQVTNIKKISKTIQQTGVLGGRSREKAKLSIQLKFAFACQEKGLIRELTKMKPFDKNLVK